MSVRRLSLVLGAAALWVAGLAAAQGLFYREEARDGSIYVFAVSADYERWVSSGTLAKAILRTGYGPHGETVVFDREAAVNLYNFKHDRPGEVFRAEKTEKPAQWRYQWKEGKTTFESERLLFNLSNRAQLRLVDELPDDATPLSGTAAKGDSQASFRFARVRTKLDGWVLRKELEYELQLDWADANSIVQDLDLNLMLKGRALQLKFGQFKIPFGRQAITSAMYQQFVDRAVFSSDFEKIRDQGIQLWGALLASKLEYRMGVFNGVGRQRTLGTAAAGNDNTDFEYVGRLMYQPFGDVRYSESDIESTDKPLLAVAVAFDSNDTRNPVVTLTLPPGATPAPAAAPTYKRRLFDADASFKYRGASGFAAYVQGTSTPASGAAFDTQGVLFQAGYFVKRAVFEVALRYGRLDPNRSVAGDDRSELGAATSYFYNGHNCKLTADLRQLEDKARKTKDRELRIQAQLVF